MRVEKSILLFILLIVFINLLSGCSVLKGEKNAEEIFTELSESTVEIYAESSFVSSLGSGFFIDDKGTVVTNFHVIKDCLNATITTSDSSIYDVTNVLGYDETLDIAILETTITDCTGVKMSTEVNTGEKVYVLGSSLGLTGTFSEGIVSSADRYIDENSYIQISAPISPGNSGGPVVNNSGEVIGIACAGFEEGQNLNLALPIEAISKISINAPMSMEEFFANTSAYSNLDEDVIVLGSELAVRSITLEDSFTAELLIAEWELGDATEISMIEIMNEYGEEQGGGQLYLIDPGVWIDEIDAWCFDSNRQPGDYAIIESSYGYSICFISFFNSHL